MTDSKLEERVWDRLRNVLDPCSCFTNDPVNVVDLGLIESVEIGDGLVRIELLTTSAACTYVPYIQREIEDELSSIPAIESILVTHNTDSIWTRDRMDADIRETRREHRNSQLREAGISPYDWDE